MFINSVASQQCMTSFARYLALIAGLVVAQPVWSQETPVEKKIVECQATYDEAADSEGLFQCLYETAGKQGAITFYQTVVRSQLAKNVDGTYNHLTTLNGGCEGSQQDFLAWFLPLMDVSLQSLEGELEGRILDLWSFEPYQEAKVAARRDLQKRIDRVASYSCN